MNKEDILKNIDSIKKKLEKFTDIRIQKRIDKDKGSNGIAYTTSKNTVLKITTDEDEALTSSKILHKDLKHVAKIYKVFEFKHLQGIWFIELEKLKDLSIREVSFLKKIPPEDTEDIKVYKRYEEQYSLSEEENLKQKLFKSYTFPENRTLIEQVLKQCPPVNTWPSSLRGFVACNNHVLVVQSFSTYFSLLSSIFEALEELIRFRIHFTDTKPANIMKTKDGAYKFIDLGWYSQAPGEPKINIIQDIHNFIGKKYNE